MGDAPAPRKLIIEPTTRCNLRCAMCLKQSRGSRIREGDMTLRTFARLQPAFPGLEGLVFSGIGEPLLHPGLEEMAAWAASLMPPGSYIGLQSNGRLLSPHRALSLASAGVSRFCLSMDASRDGLLGRLRAGARLDSLEAALDTLSQEGKALNPGLRLGVEMVISRGNLAELPALVQYAAGHGADFMLVSHLLPYSPEAVAEALYQPSTDASLEIFARYRERAGAEGLDLEKYWRGLCRFCPDQDQARVMELVSEMVREGLRRDIFLDLRKLLDHDPRREEMIRKVFEQALEVAESHGMRLSLPAVTPRQERRCAFVEENAALVAWDGAVHPCHYLWHGCRSYFDGREKLVAPKVLGNLQQDDINAVWQSRLYREFRDEVVRYDYPHCSNCPMAPCDFIDVEEFESDCYSRKVPCGDCPWCHGLLQCLQ